MQLRQILENKKISSQKTFKFWRPEVGTDNKIVFLNWEESPSNEHEEFGKLNPFGMSYFSHYALNHIVTKNELEKILKEIDDKCDAIKASRGSEVAKNSRRELKPRMRYCLPILDLSDKEIYLWDIGKSTYDNIIDNYDDNDFIYSRINTKVTPFLIRKVKIHNGPFSKIELLPYRKQLEIGMITPRLPSFENLYYKSLGDLSFYKKNLQDYVNNIQFGKVEDSI